jgi:hypothetical protein
MGDLGIMDFKFSGLVIAQSGLIFGVPFNSKSILCINPQRHEATTFGAVSLGGCKWGGGILAGDGKIYCTPFGPAARGVLAIDPDMTTTSIISENMEHLGHISGKWDGAVIAFDGKIYCIPHSAEEVLRIAPRLWPDIQICGKDGFRS